MLLDQDGISPSPSRRATLTLEPDEQLDRADQSRPRPARRRRSRRRLTSCTAPSLRRWKKKRSADQVLDACLLKPPMPRRPGQRGPGRRRRSRGLREQEDRRRATGDHRAACATNSPAASTCRKVTSRSLAITRTYDECDGAVLRPTRTARSTPRPATPTSSRTPAGRRDARKPLRRFHRRSGTTATTPSNGCPANWCNGKVDVTGTPSAFEDLRPAGVSPGPPHLVAAFVIVARNVSLRRRRVQPGYERWTAASTSMTASTLGRRPTSPPSVADDVLHNALQPHPDLRATAAGTACSRRRVQQRLRQLQVRSRRARGGFKLKWAHSLRRWRAISNTRAVPDLRRRRSEIRWFDLRLKGVDNGIMDEPPVRLRWPRPARAIRRPELRWLRFHRQLRRRRRRSPGYFSAMTEACRVRRHRQRSASARLQSPPASSPDAGQFEPDLEGPMDCGRWRAARTTSPDRRAGCRRRRYRRTGGMNSTSTDGPDTRTRW